jgi:hypothetical protein
MASIKLGLKRRVNAKPELKLNGSWGLYDVRRLSPASDQIITKNSVIFL